MAFTTRCPHCDKSLTVPDEAVGKMVRCPGCHNAFPIAEPSDAIAPVEVVPPPVVKVAAAWDQESSAERRKREDAKRERKKRRDDEDEDENEEEPAKEPEGKQKPNDVANPFSLPDDDDDLPRYAPHRGGTILAMGILSFVLGCVPLAFVTVSMANFDIIQMALKKMDPAGKTMTQVGKVLAIVSLLMTALATLLVCCGLIAGGGRFR